MVHDLRGLVFIAVLVVLGAVFIAIPRINFEVYNFEFDRGNDDAFLGLNLGLDLQGGTHLIYDIVTEDGEPPTPEDVEGIRAIIERRVNAFGVSEPTVQVLGNPPDRILIQLPGQSESSLNVTIDGGDTTIDDVKAFFESDLAKSGVEVFENEDGSLIITFDEFDGSEADAWRTQFQEKYPITIRATFEYEIVVPDLNVTTSLDADTDAPGGEGDDDAGGEHADGDADPESAQTEDDAAAQGGELPPPARLAPTTEEVQAAFEAAGFTDAVVSDGTDTVLFLT
ncbi:MAG: hypothetical protein F4X40_08920, partial [Chloroflexi bacterium]|nr:hypothetical protein [Chloroflexota bacterium]